MKYRLIKQGKIPKQRKDKYTLDDVTILVTCFLRFDKLEQFLRSVRYYYPSTPIIVCDNSGHSHILRRFPNVTWVEAEYDCGVSGVRNRGFPHVKTKLAVLCEEDFYFTQETKLENYLSVMNETDCDIVGGAYRDIVDVNVGPAKQWTGQLEIKNAVLHHTSLSSPWKQTETGVWYRNTDILMNWFLAKVPIPECDEQFKAGHEHIDWFLSMKDKYIVYTPNCIINHDKTGRTEQYLKHRNRSHREELYAKWGVKEHYSHNIVKEKGIPPFQPVKETSDNIVLLTIGHTGSTVVNELLQLLGWNLPDNDPEFNEPYFTKGSPCDLSQLKEPWSLKDPRFCETLESWLPKLLKFKPKLVFLQRNLKDVEKSYIRRGENPETARRRLALANKHYKYWPWKKCRVNYESLKSWAQQIR